MKNKKEDYLLDFSFNSLNKLENKVTKLYEKDPEAVSELHVDLVSMVISRMIIRGWDKNELIKFTTEMVEDAANDLIEFETAESGHNVISIRS